MRLKVAKGTAGFGRCVGEAKGPSILPFLRSSAISAATVSQSGSTRYACSLFTTKESLARSRVAVTFITSNFQPVPGCMRRSRFLIKTSLLSGKAIPLMSARFTPLVVQEDLAQRLAQDLRPHAQGYQHSKQFCLEHRVVAVTHKVHA